VTELLQQMFTGLSKGRYLGRTFTDPFFFLKLVANYCGLIKHCYIVNCAEAGLSLVTGSKKQMHPAGHYYRLKVHLLTSNNVSYIIVSGKQT